jgi:hypothetical protein
VHRRRPAALGLRVAEDSRRTAAPPARRLRPIFSPSSRTRSATRPASHAHSAASSNRTTLTSASSKKKSHAPAYASCATTNTRDGLTAARSCGSAATKAQAAAKAPAACASTSPKTPNQYLSPRPTRARYGTASRHAQTDPQIKARPSPHPNVPARLLTHLAASTNPSTAFCCAAMQIPERAGQHVSSR